MPDKVTAMLIAYVAPDGLIVERKFEIAGGEPRTLSIQDPGGRRE